MSRGPVHPRAVGQVVLTIVALIAIGGIIELVHDAAPEQSLPSLVPATDEDVVTCERTLPDAPESREAIEEVDPVGRVTSSEVIACPDAFDGQVVVYVGEVVGDVLGRTGGAWTLVNDDDYALRTGPLSGHTEFSGSNSGLSVWLPDPLPEMVGHAGGPDRRGDVMRIRGVIRRADPADGGGLTLRATSAEVIAPSEVVEQPIHVGQVVTAAAFVAAALAFVAIERAAARRR